MGTSVTTPPIVPRVWSFWTTLKDDKRTAATISNSRPISPPHQRIWSGPENRGPQERTTERYANLWDDLLNAFIGAHIGLPADHLEDHAAYIDGWLKALGDNPSSFLTAASKAQAAADWVLGEMDLGQTRVQP